MNNQQKQIKKLKNNNYVRQQKRSKQILNQKNFAQIAQEDVETARRVGSYKNKIVIMLCVMALLPSVWSIAMLYQLSDLENQVNLLVNEKKSAIESEMVTGQNVTAFGEKEETQVVDSNETALEESNRVYLTFDDGPTEYTQEILDILEKYNAKATFFVVGKEGESAKNAYQSILKAGHTIGIHSYTHEYNQIYSSLDAFMEDVTKTSDLIYEATGVRTKLYRFPGGSANTVCATSKEDLIRWLDGEGYVYYDWNALSGDAVTKGLSPATLVKNVMDGVTKHQNGTSIVLMHDLATRHNMVEALEPLLQRLVKDGYKIDKPLTEEVTPIQQKKLEDVIYNE